MPDIGGFGSCYRCCRRFRRCCLVGAREEESLSALRRRMNDIDDHLSDAMYKIYPPKRVDNYLNLERELGSGGFGIVYYGTATPAGVESIPGLQEGHSYAIKRLLLQRTMPEEICRSLLNVSVARHLEFIQSMRRPECSEAHVVKFFAFIVEFPRSIYQVMEFLEGFDLFDFLASRTEGIEEHTAARLVKQIVTAVHHLHRHVGILHRDIKPENFGFLRPVPTDGGEMPPLKLIDLGLAWVLPEPIKDNTCRRLFNVPAHGTPIYMAPEMWTEECGAPSDVWSVGLLMYLLLGLDLPFGLLSCKKPLNAIRSNELTFGDSFEGVTEAAKEMTKLLLEKDPTARTTTPDILNNPWFANPGTKRGSVRSVFNKVASRTTHDGEATLWHTLANVSQAPAS